MVQRVNQMPEKLRRQRKMLLILPLIVVPLLCLAFHGLGGGKGGTKQAEARQGKGLNMALPEARFDPRKKVLNKLGFYKQADQDSLRLLESRKLDPYYTRSGMVRDSGRRLYGGMIPSGRDTGWMAGKFDGGVRLGGLASGASGADVRADELLQKLDRLKEVLGRQEAASMPEKPGLPRMGAGMYGGRPVPGVSEALSGGVAGLSLSGHGDPDLDKLSGMLDKILRIQHPGEDHGVDSAGAAREVLVPGTLSLPKKEEAVKMLVGGEYRSGKELDSVGSDPGGGFMELDDEQTLSASSGDAVKTVIAQDQTLVSGEAVELRLEEEALINGVRIPKGSDIWGKASLNGERLLVTVSSVLIGGSPVPVSLEVFDLDGMAGVRVPGAIGRDVSKQSADEAIGTVGAGTFDASLSGQAAAAGVQAAKSLLSRKVRLVRVSLKAGYRVLLKNTKTK